jgi:hypothetical protein
VAGGIAQCLCVSCKGSGAAAPVEPIRHAPVSVTRRRPRSNETSRQFQQAPLSLLSWLSQHGKVTPSSQLLRHTRQHNRMI